MDKIWIIMFNNGDCYEDTVDVPWTFCESEEEAEEKVEELERQLKKDIERYNYLETHPELVYGEDGNYSNSDTSMEYQQLDSKYPYTRLYSAKIPFFYIFELGKK